MIVTMEQVRSALEPEEPDYSRAARLGPEALPHLKAIIREGDPMLASKATYLAGLIADEQSASVLEEAAKSEHPTVRVAAAAAARHLSAAASSQVLNMLLDDHDTGVRKVALQSVPAGAPEALRNKVEVLNRTDPESSIRTLSSHVLERMRP